MKDLFPIPSLSQKSKLGIVVLLCAYSSIQAQAPSKLAPPAADKDVLVLTNGEKLIGKLQRSTGTSVVFHSDMAGDVTVDWTKIKDLQSGRKFAVVPKGVNVEKPESAKEVVQGPVSVVDGKLQIKPSAQSEVTLPVSQAADVIDAQTFENVVLRRPAWYQKWKGSATVGLSLVKATQQNQNYTSAVSLVRSIPGEDWMNPENKTSFTFTSSFGKLTQPNTPEVKTSIYHGEAERDKYISPHFFVFAEASFDHDFSQGLDLEQTYGAGLGWTVFKNANSQLDIKHRLAYISQMFSDSATNQNLIGSVFSETYNRKLLKKITLHQDVSSSRAWSNLNVYSLTGNANLAVPVIKQLNFTVGILDTFLNNPSPGFQKNSFQFTSGITYVTP